MPMPNPFETAVDFVLTAEGGLIDDPSDPGGLAKFGISQRASDAATNFKCKGRWSGRIIHVSRSSANNLFDHCRADCKKIGGLCTCTVGRHGWPRVVQAAG